MLKDKTPLVLDLDGTLIRTDTFHEMIILLFKRKPWKLLALPSWFSKGRAYAKARLVEETSLKAHDLPYNPPLLDFAKTQAEKGRPLFIATGSDQRTAQDIANHLGFFQGVMGSDGQTNLTGPHKRKALLEKFGDQGFDYAGDSLVDLHIWGVARKAIVVHPKKRVIKEAITLKGIDNTHIFPREIKRPLAFFLSLRPLFWFTSFLAPTWEFGLGLCFLTSGVFMTCDLLTLIQERSGTSPKSIFAEGHLHLTTAFYLAPALLLITLCFIPFLTFVWYAPLVFLMDYITRTLSFTLRWGVLITLQILTLLFVI